MIYAPDLLNPSVHDHEDKDPQERIRDEKRMMRARRIAAKWGPRDYAKQFLRSYMQAGWELEDIIRTPSASGHIHAHVEVLFGRLPKGKIRASTWNHPAEIFSINELAAELEQEKVQGTLL